MGIFIVSIVGTNLEKLPCLFTSLRGKQSAELLATGDNFLCMLDLMARCRLGACHVYGTIDRALLKPLPINGRCRQHHHTIAFESPLMLCVGLRNWRRQRRLSTIGSEVRFHGSMEETPGSVDSLAKFQRTTGRCFDRWQE